MRFRRTIPWILSAFLLLGSVGAGYAAPPAKASPWNIETLMHGLAGNRHHSAHFIEKKYIAVLDTPVISSGELRYIPPDHLEKHTTSPKDELMTLDGDVLTLKQDQKTYTLRLSEHPAAVAYADSIRGLLSGNLKVLRQAYRLQLTGDRRHWSLLLHPTNRDVAQLIDSISVNGSGTDIQTIEYDQSDGDHTVMTIEHRSAP